MAAFFMLNAIFFCGLIFFVVADQSGLETYIVHVRKPEVVAQTSEHLEEWYESFLPTTIAESSSGEKSRLVYSYRNVVSGFAVRLTKDELKAMQGKDGFIFAQPDRVSKLHTTHTPNFLGLHQKFGFWKESNFGRGVIIGVLDTGIFPTHPSFDDERMPPPPAKWKGQCDFNVSECNNKLIGAKSFNKGAKAIAPLDDEGHGTHTASTAAGNFVKNVNVLGNAQGTAVGMAPYAHLAMYKVCFGDDCLDSDILAALDAAVEDGVDVLSLSLGAPSVPFYMDSIAIGSFGAIQKGIFVSCSAGNSGPLNATLSNEAPWILTVGASTIDRKIKATAKLGNGIEYNGESLFQPSGFSSALFPLIYAGADGEPNSKFCGEGAFNKTNVKGKIVLCERGNGVGRIAKGEAVKNAGGAGMILINQETDGFSTLADAHVLPATHLSFASGLKIKDYINSSSSPVAKILFEGTFIGDTSAPAVTSFSSRGPSLASPGILKPDIIGPGVSILAAWPFSLDNNTNSDLTYNIISGTSMSCPHLSGIAALLKSSHPDWSPAAIKSAIMTTADLLNLKRQPIVDQNFELANLFATGSGHVNPSKANDPGLIYDIQAEDYIPYLCGLGYSDDQVGIIAHRVIKCSEYTTISEYQLNYPSFTVPMIGTTMFTRTVTNVGEANSTYGVEIVEPDGVSVSVKPNMLYFTEMNQKLSYSVMFSRNRFATDASISEGFIQWVSNKHLVRSPISAVFV
ncbi:hypothetical protein MKW98_002858 [Papaver atlanticum]|uniref:Uncharacterized protein n=1 Tax=Papaver atlanticum TaxID=357466 RepID=A0AAD4XLD9_9MAGN|nr:hypothetical protein MKW98_002858 [Papaver atlanticum]